LVGEQMIADFTRGGEIDAIMQRLSEIKTDVAAAIAKEDRLFMELNPAAFDAGASLLYRRLSLIRPYGICPYCSGDGCKSCHMRGWLGKEAYEVAPPDSK
jgi:hypothetical protein